MLIESMTKIKTFLSFPFRHKKLAIVLIIVIAILWFVFAPKGAEPIETEKISKQDIVESITANGQVNSESSVSLNFLITGELVYVGAQKGDAVTAGQTIAMLDQRSVQKNLQNELADYSIQRNTFDETIYDNQNRTPEQALNDSMMRVLQTNQYSLEQAVISVELQSLANEQSVLTSPIDGVLIRADATVPGTNVATTTTYQVADPDSITFDIDVDETDIGKVKVGLPVEVTLEAYLDDPITLTIEEIDFASHESDNGANVYTVRARFPHNDDYKYRLGMNGDAEIVLSKKANVLTVPIGSIFDENYVYVKQGDTYEKRKVDFGIQSDVDIEVIDGVREGEEVVLIPDNVEEFLNNQKKFFFF